MHRGSNSKPVLQIQNLHCSYEPLAPVLRGVELCVREGERVALIGPNGSGKSTLLKCAMGLLRFSAGTVSVAGRDVRAYNMRQLAGRIAYVPQAGDGGLPFRVRDFVLMGRYSHRSWMGAASAEDGMAVEKALELTGTTRFADRIHATLSGGERQKVMLAAALAQESPLLLLDEPSAFLDPGHKFEIDRILREVNESRGVTILAATHDLNRAVLGHERIIGLREGRVVCDAPSGEALTDEILRTLFATDFATVSHPETGERMILPKAVK